MIYYKLHSPFDEIYDQNQINISRFQFNNVMLILLELFFFCHFYIL